MVGNTLAAIVHLHGHFVVLEGEAVPLHNHLQGIFVIETAVNRWKRLPAPQWSWRRCSIGIVFQHLVVTLSIDHKSIAVHFLTALPQAEGQPISCIETSAVLFYLYRQGEI